MKPCPHFLKRFAVLAAASLILSAVTLSASAAAAPVKYEEKRSTVTTVDGAQKKEDLAVTVEYQVGSTSIRAYTVEKDEVIGVSKDMWSLYGAFTSDWITDGTYTLSQPLNSVEQITVSVPYGDTARTNESYFVFHVPEGTVVTTPSWSYDMDLYKGKTIADVKAVVEAGQDPNTLIDIEDDYDPFGPDRSDAGKQGTGLGLSITKAIFQQHGFRFGVHSTVGKGTVFWFIMTDTEEVSS